MAEIEVTRASLVDEGPCPVAEVGRQQVTGSQQSPEVVDISEEQAPGGQPPPEVVDATKKPPGKIIHAELDLIQFRVFGTLRGPWCHV